MNNQFIGNPKVKIIASKDSWIEGSAIDQLNKTSAFDGVECAVGLPDLHPGNGNPVGAAYIIEDIIYPFLIGNDVGCGIGLFISTIKKNKIKIDKWIRRFEDLNEPYDGEFEAWLSEFELSSSLADAALGTIGGGNHFVELQSIDKIYDQEAFEALKLDKNYLYVLVHSGSRGIGESLLRQHTEKYGAKGISIGSSKAQAYLKQHDIALKWAACNRAVIAWRFANAINAECRSVIDVCHNGITMIANTENSLWLHRKGAAPSDSGPIVIPGSRGSLSYLVKPKGDQKDNLWSLPHGAGRKWNRGSCKERLRSRFNRKSLVKTEIGSHVICENKDLLYEEAPQAYKNIDNVIDDLLNAELVSIVATLKPIITYKM